MNCYYLAGTQVNCEGVTAVTADQFTSGEVAYLLQAGVPGEDIYDDDWNYVETITPHIWGQNIGTDDYPSVGGAKVNFGYADCGNVQPVYTNKSVSDSRPDHEGSIVYTKDGENATHTGSYDCCGTVVVENQECSGDTQNCMGYQCLTCGGMYGEKSEEHPFNSETGNCQVCEKPMAQAKIGSVYYETFDDAEEDWVDGSTLVLVSDVPQHIGTIQIADKSVTLDLNGYTLNEYFDSGIGLVDYATVLVREGSKLTIQDSDPEQKGTLASCVTSIKVYGTMDIISGKILMTVSYNTPYYSTMDIYEGGVLNMTGGIIEGGPTTGSILNDGTINISGGSLICHYVLRNQKGTVNISGSPVLGDGSSYGVNTGTGSVTISGSPVFDGITMRVCSTVTLNTQPAEGEVWRVSPDNACFTKYDGIFAIPGEGVELDESRFVSTDPTCWIHKNEDGSLSIKRLRDEITTVMNPSENLAIGFRVPEVGVPNAAYAILTCNKEPVRVDRTEWFLEDGVYTIYHTGVASTQMYDAVYIDFYDADGKRINLQYTLLSTVRDHAISILESDASDAVKTMYMDLLNYGSAAQVHFDYKADAPVNNGLDAYQHYATQKVALNDQREKGTGYSATTLEMESELQLNLLFSKNTVKKKMYAVITITDEDGKVDKRRIEGSDFKSHTNNRWRIEIEGLSPSDYDHLIKCEIYDGDTLVTSATDSIGSYLTRAINGGGGEVYEMALRYCQSAKANA